MDINKKTSNRVNKKVASEFAVGVILLVAIVVGGISWFNSAKEIAALDAEAGKIQLVKNPKISSQPAKNGEKIKATEEPSKENSCQPHYYEGKARVSAWIISESEDGLIVAIKKDEVSKLPLVDSETTNNKSNFTVKLIDPTDEIKAKIAASSPQKPATITVQGYAEICEQPPLVSIKPATEAFKKRS